MNRLKIILVAILAVVAVVAAIIYFKNFDPTVYPLLRCPIKALTGLNCPGCGCQRALHALLNGRFVEAWHYNSFIFAATPIALLYIVVEAYPHRFARLYRWLVNPIAAGVVLIAIIVVFIVKN
jgi:hypothetical protein